MPLVIFDAPLGAAFVPSRGFIIANERITLDFTLVVTLLATVQWFLEFTSGDPNDPATLWTREVAEEALAGGGANMPKVIRTFQEFGGAGLAVGTHLLSAHLIRAHQFCRIQMRITVGTASARVVSVFTGGN